MKPRKALLGKTVKSSQAAESSKENIKFLFIYLFSKPRVRSWFFLGLGFAWAAAVLFSYYFQLWNLLLYRNSPGVSFHGDLSLPYFREALLRGTIGITSSAYLMISAYLIGRIIIDYFGVEFTRLGERITYTVSLGIGFFSFAGLGLAAAGLYKPGILIVLASFPTIISIGRWLLSGRRRVQLRFDLSALQTYNNRIWIICIILAAGFSFLAALAPEREYDALWYHLNYPRIYLEQGRIVDQIYDYVSLYPMTWELWFGYGLSLGNQIGAKLLHFAMLPLTGIVIYEMARRFGGAVSPWLAVAIFATVPTVMWEASTAYIDLALAFHTTLFVNALLLYANTRCKLWFLLSGYNLGMAVASKHLALFFLLMGVLLLFIFLWIQDRRIKSAAVPALLLAFLGVAPALPWYLRSFLATGNPVFPELFGLFGAPPERWDIYTRAGLDQFLEQFGRSRTVWNLFSLPWHFTIHGASYHGSLGPLFLILIPSIFFRKIRKEGAWLLSIIIFYIILWASPFSSFQLRFLIPLAPLLAVLAASGFGRLCAASRVALGRRGPILLSVGLFVLLFLNLPPFTFLHERDRVGWDGWLNHVLHGEEWAVVIGAESQDAYLRRQVRSYAVWHFADHNLDNNAYVLTWTGGDHYYTSTKRIWAYSTAARRAVWAEPGEKEVILAELSALGVTHLITDNDYRALLEDSYSENAYWLDLLYQDGFYTLYRILWGEQGPINIDGNAGEPT
jgi:4-amino-4-deoxy-L-arabinose transferase-like glycosyltransferase